ncbi:hypothetical protein [Mesorhizobium sp. ESP7-2]|uniref:hypothetical protein n=1 Tax=Mesorhizobium sp. ESP7-2 TaxID=2876622 RepID=UPI00398C4C03
MVERHGAAHATGFDVEHPVIVAARQRATARALAERTSFIQGPPGLCPLPIAPSMSSFPRTRCCMYVTRTPCSPRFSAC